MREFLNNLGLFVLRAASGGMMATHGYSKIFVEGRMDGFITGVGEMGFPLPVLFAWAAALSELVGGVLLALGCGTRITAGLIGITMVVAAFIRHASDPFKAKELALLYLAVMIFFALYGGGRWAVERFFKCKG